MMERKTTTSGPFIPRGSEGLRPRTAGGGQPRLRHALALARLLAVAGRGMEAAVARAEGGIEGGASTSGQMAGPLRAIAESSADPAARLAALPRREEHGQGRPREAAEQERDEGGGSRIVSIEHEGPPERTFQDRGAAGGRPG